jgi:hypothetical protein
LIDRLPCPRETASRRRAEHRRDGLEQAMIRRAVACDGRPHQAGPFVIPLAHLRSYPAIRLIFQIVTPALSDHEIVIQPSGSSKAAIGNLERSSCEARRLLPSIG